MADNLSDIKIEVNFDLKDPTPQVLKALERATLISAVLVQNDARKLAPKDTGDLISSISVDHQKLTASVFSNLDYAVYQEFGTVKFPAGNPFLRPALANNTSKIIKIYALALEGA